MLLQHQVHGPHGGFASRGCSGGRLLQRPPSIFAHLGKDSKTKTSFLLSEWVMLEGSLHLFLSVEVHLGSPPL